MLGDCQQVKQDTTQPGRAKEQSEDILEHNPQRHHRPAELAANPSAPSKIGLHDQKNHRTPEHYFKSIQDPVGLVALPAPESLDVLGGDLVCDEHEGFGTLCLC